MTIEIVKPKSPTVYKGDEFTLAFQLRDERTDTDGSDPHALVGTETVTAYFRAASSSTPVSKACSITDAATGKVSVTLTEAESATLAEGDNLPVSIVVETVGGVTSTFDLLEAVNIRARSVS